MALAGEHRLPAATLERHDPDRRVTIADPSDVLAAAQDADVVGCSAGLPGDGEPLPDRLAERVPVVAAGSPSLSTDGGARFEFCPQST